MTRTRRRIATVALGLGILIVAALGVVMVHTAGQAPTAYSCGGHLTVTGIPERGQAGLVRCYVEAVRRSDTRLLAKIEEDGYTEPLPRPSEAPLPVTANFYDFDTGMGDERVRITFADGSNVTLRVVMAANGDEVWSGPPAWRLGPAP